MPATFHLLLFIPDLELKTRFTVGATVEEEGRLTWVEAPLLPPNDFLRPGNRSLLRVALEALRAAPECGLPRNPFPPEALDDPPGTRPPRLSNLGNHLRAEPPQRIPDAIEDPIRWVREHYLPQLHDPSAADMASKRSQAG